MSFKLIAMTFFLFGFCKKFLEIYKFQCQSSMVVHEIHHIYLCPLYVFFFIVWQFQVT